jgi:hypothetical protein
MRSAIKLHTLLAITGCHLPSTILCPFLLPIISCLSFLRDVDLLHNDIISQELQALLNVLLSKLESLNLSGNWLADQEGAG